MFSPIEVHKIDLLYDLKVGINKHDNDYIDDYNEVIKKFYKFSLRVNKLMIEKTNKIGLKVI